MSQEMQDLVVARATQLMREERARTPIRTWWRDLMLRFEYWRNRRYY